MFVEIYFTADIYCVTVKYTQEVTVWHVCYGMYKMRI
jgi:hypothetical protein